MKPKPVKRATNVKAELLEEEEPETESYLNYIQNYYGEVHFHIYEGGILIQQSGNPNNPLPPYKP